MKLQEAKAVLHQHKEIIKSCYYPTPSTNELVAAIDVVCGAPMESDANPVPELEPDMNAVELHQFLNKLCEKDGHHAN